MPSKETIKERLTRRKTVLNAAYEAYEALMAGQVKSYTIGTRNLTRLDLPQLETSIAKLEREVDQLEAMLVGGRRRKAVGVVPRDI